MRFPIVHVFVAVLNVPDAEIMYKPAGNVYVIFTFVAFEGPLLYTVILYVIFPPTFNVEFNTFIVIPMSESLDVVFSDIASLPL